jgi:hypothetical protein
MLLSKLICTKGASVITVEFNLITPLSELQKKNHRVYTYADIANVSGLTRQGVRRLLTQGTKQVEVDTLGKLLDFFASEGMPVTLNDLFTVH